MWWKITVVDMGGTEYIRFGTAETPEEAWAMAEKECECGDGLRVKSVDREPLGATAVFIYGTPPPYPGDRRPIS